MEPDKITIPLDGALAKHVLRAAKRTGRDASGWVADAIAERLKSGPDAAEWRADALREALDEWEREYGPLTEAELEAARAEFESAQAQLGIRANKPD